MDKNNNYEFDQLPQILFNGVPYLRTIGCPGTLLPIKQNTRAIICGANSNDVVGAAACVGRGRCLVFAHDGYGKMFMGSQSQDQVFIGNCRQWLSKNSEARFTSIDTAASFDEIETNGTILIWHDHSTKSKTFMENLVSVFVTLVFGEY